MLNTTEKTANIWLDTLEKENVYLTLRCMSSFFSRFSRFNLIRVVLDDQYSPPVFTAGVHRL